MGKRIHQLLSSLAVLFFMASFAAAHCEIPCGIYDDEMRFQMIAEHITTIEKSMKEIQAIQKETPVNYNQLIRWIMNKEEHANYFAGVGDSQCVVCHEEIGHSNLNRYLLEIKYRSGE